MSRGELEEELELAEELAKTEKTWRNAVSEYRRVLAIGRPKHARHDKNNIPVLDLPPTAMAGLIQALGVELRMIEDGRHRLYLALAGTLLGRGLPGAELPAIIAGISREAGDEKIGARVSDAMSTVSCWERNAPVTGYLTLKTDWSTVAAIIDEYLPRPRSSVHEQIGHQLTLPPDAPLVTLSEAEHAVSAAFHAAIENPGKLFLLRVPPGVGKTRQAVTFAVEHQGKVALVHPSNAVAKTHYHLAEELQPGRSSRRFGVLALENPDGNPVCSRAKTASILQGGGIPVPQRLCIRCRQQETCEAATGREGARTAPIALMNHAMIGVAVDHVGSKGVLVLDECPAPILHAKISNEDLVRTENALRAFVFPNAFASACIPLSKLLLESRDLVGDGDTVYDGLRAASAELQKNDVLSREFLAAHVGFGAFEPGELDRFDVPHEVMPPSLTGRYEEDAVALFRAAFAQWPNHSVPPMRRATSLALVSTLTHTNPRDLALASKTLATLGHVVTSCGTVYSSWNVTSDDDEAWLSVAYPNPALQKALGRSGPTIVLDGTVDKLALALVAQRPIETIEQRVVDMSPVTRIVVASSKGAKAHLAPRNRINWAEFGALCSHALTHLDLTNTTNILIVSHKACVETFRTTLGATIPHTRLRQFVDTIRQNGGRVVLGHFGNLKGRNEFDGLSWEDLHAVVTVGDPWPDVGAIGAENRLLHLSHEEADDRLRSLVAAELGQAHGRLRTPRQTKPTMAVHVGSIVPFGWDNTNTIIDQPAEGRPPNLSAMTPMELQLLIGLAGSGRKLAVAAGVDETTVRRYLKGRAIPPEFAAKARSLYAPLNSAHEEDYPCEPGDAGPSHNHGGNLPMPSESMNFLSGTDHDAGRTKTVLEPTEFPPVSAA